MHKVILEKVSKMPEIYRNLFEYWRILMGVENAYARVVETMGRDRQMGGAL